MLRLLAWVAFALSVAVFARRGLAAWQAAAMPPGTAVTSGFEWESHFAIWRAVHHRLVYTDPLQPPFSAAYFNWLFYDGYGAVLAPCVAHAGDAVIPIAGRLLSAAVAIAGAGILFVPFRALLGPGRSPFAGAAAAFFFAGPLMGWWAHTVRPDVAALMFETGGLTALLLLRASRSWTATVVGLLLFYAAWSCKQTSVMALAASVLFLLARRQWWHAGVLALGWGVLVAGTFLVLGPGYRVAQYSTATTNVFYWSAGFWNFADATIKSVPFLLLAAAALPRRGCPPAPISLAADTRLLGGLGLMIGLPFSYVTSCKLGAASNYYFTPALMLALFAVAAVATSRSFVPAMLACAAAVALQLAVLAGAAGNVDLTPQAQALGREWAVFNRLPEPRYSADYRLSLPWLSRHSPPVMPAFNYPLQYAMGAAFKGGGIGGMVADGRFASLLLPRSTTSTYYGGQLTHYHRGQSVDNYAVYLRTPPAPR